MHIQKPLRITKGNNSKELAPSPYIFYISICLVYINELAKFDEIPSRTLQDIKEQNIMDTCTADGQTT